MSPLKLSRAIETMPSLGLRSRKQRGAALCCLILGRPVIITLRVSALALGSPAKAIRSYRRALSLDPSHTDTITALGRLQFRPPEQPLVSEMRRLVPEAVCHGYHAWNDGVVSEQEAMYDALMSAYGKDDFPES